MNDAAAIWVTSEALPDGRYITAIAVSDDQTFALDRDRARRYATTVHTAVSYAEYDAAVLRQLTTIGVPVELAATVVKDLRADRPPLDDAATAPIRFEPVVLSRTRKPAVQLSYNGTMFCEWTPEDARGHAGHVLEASVVVDLDDAYRRLLVAQLGLVDGKARAIVGDLGEYRTWDVTGRRQSEPGS